MTTNAATMKRTLPIVSQQVLVAMTESKFREGIRTVIGEW